MEKGATIKHDIKNAADTGSWRTERPEVINKKCTGCGTCVKHCPEAVIDLVDRDPKEESKFPKLAKVSFDFCKGCGVCKEVCPFKAVDMKKE